MPLQDCEFTITAILEDLQKDPWPVKNDHRPLRATGVAMAVAVGLLEATCKGNPARTMCFVGGPCTQGPGLVVGDELNEALRSHHDLIKETAPHYKKALKHFSTLAAKSVENGHAIDLFCCCLDQVLSFVARILM